MANYNKDDLNRMPKILFINTVSGFSSTGKITGELASLPGYESLICFGRKKDYLNKDAYNSQVFLIIA